MVVGSPQLLAAFMPDPSTASAAQNAAAARSAEDAARDAEAERLLAEVTANPDAGHTMQCMEVWGGNTAIDSVVAMPGLDCHVFSRPYKGDAAGGDVHYVSSCATGRIARVLVADVAGHGERVAQLAVGLRGLMRRYINYLDQTAFVRQLNKEFGQLSTVGRFATAIVATYWAPTDYLVATNAGHPRPLHYSQGRNSWMILKDKPRPGDAGATSNIPLGIDEVASYDQFAVKLKPGDVVVLYTDSLIEAGPPGPGQTMLGEDGLLRIARELDPSDPQQFIEQLVARVEAYAGGTPQDDVTILLLRCTQRKPMPTPAARFGAVVSFLQTLAGSWRKDAAPVPWPELSLINLLGPFLPFLNNRHGGGAGAKPPAPR